MPSFKLNTHPVWPQDVGIIAIEVYFPSQFVCQRELEEFDGVSQGKYTIGLGQSKMGFCSDCEDINSICLTALSKLMERTGVGYDQIGHLEVGTETIIDKSKSVKSVLMQLFEESGNVDIEGVDSVNACYGGTAALFNSISWIESSAWDGRYAVVVAGDIAVYAQGSARPTGGAGSVAMLVGPNAPLVLERGLRASFMKHVYDFYKPELHSEYPVVDGKLSIQYYLTALDECYQRYLRKAAEKNLGYPSPKSLDDFDIFAFHSPFCKLVQKSFARLVFIDFLHSASVKEKFDGLEKFKGKLLEETYFDKEVEKAFMAYSMKEFEMKTKPSLLLSSEVGNMYTASLYGGIVSILCSMSAQALAGRRIGLFSYGSGLAATLFSIHVSKDHSSHSPLARMIQAAQDIRPRLLERIQIAPPVFTQVMTLREASHNTASRLPLDDPSRLFPGTWHLTAIDEMYRRQYRRTPHRPSPLQKEATSSHYVNSHNGEVREVTSS